MFRESWLMAVRGVDGCPLIAAGNERPRPRGRYGETAINGEILIWPNGLIEPLIGSCRLYSWPTRHKSTCHARYRPIYTPPPLEDFFPFDIVYRPTCTSLVINLRIVIYKASRLSVNFLRKEKKKKREKRKEKKNSKLMNVAFFFCFR